MFESNLNIVIKCLLKDDNDNLLSRTITDIYEMWYAVWHESITITSIEVRLPQFSIWDTVMIIDTGEIWEIDVYDRRWELRVCWDWRLKEVSENQIAKIPTDLIPLLTTP